MISPLIVNQLSATYSYSFKICCTVIALIYVVLMVKTPLDKPMTKVKKNLNIIDMFKPLLDMCKTLFVCRTNKLHWIVFVQFTLYAIYTSSWEEEQVRSFTYKNHLDLLEQIFHICMYSSKASDLLAYLSFYQL